jgi:hypothetical protein
MIDCGTARRSTGTATTGEPDVEGWTIWTGVSSAGTGCAEVACCRSGATIVTGACICGAGASDTDAASVIGRKGAGLADNGGAAITCAGAIPVIMSWSIAASGAGCSDCAVVGFSRAGMDWSMVFTAGCGGFTAAAGAGCG